MVAGTSALLAAMGLIVVAAYLALLFFRRFRVPDVALLLLLGAVVGPVSGAVDPKLLRPLVPLVGTVTIVVILFEAGLKVPKSDLVGWTSWGALLALVVFLVTTFLCAALAMVLVGMAAVPAFLLGMVLGGAGVAIVIPLIAQLGASGRVQTLVSMEAAISDVLVVVGVTAMSSAVASGGLGPGPLVGHFVAHVAIGIGLGAAVGFGWAAAMRAFRERSYEYVLTIAMLFLLHAASEGVGGSGALAVLTFGLVLGNSRKRSDVRSGAFNLLPVFGTDLMHIQHETVFVLRAFFFVMLGMSIDPLLIRDPAFLVAGTVLAVGVALARTVSVFAVFTRSPLSVREKTEVSLMFPLGLAAAALSLVPSQTYGLAGTQVIAGYAAATILATNVLTAAAVFVAGRVWPRPVQGSDARSFMETSTVVK